MTNIKTDVLLIGDSGASAVNGQTGKDRAGWPQLLGIPAANNLARSGTTAEDWTAFPVWTDITKTTVIVSLAANDLFKAVSDGNITACDVFKLFESYETVIDRLNGSPLGTCYCVTYPDPFFGKNKAVKEIQAVANKIIRYVVEKHTGFCHTLTFDKWLTKKHFTGKDVHPNTAGHKELAKKIKEVLS